MLSTPPSTAAASLERKGFHTLYSTFVPSSFYNAQIIKQQKKISTKNKSQWIEFKIYVITIVHSSSSSLKWKVIEK
jgi:hypothetical protein